MDYPVCSATNGMVAHVKGAGLSVMNIIGWSAYPESALNDALYAANLVKSYTDIRKTQIRANAFVLFAEYAKKMKIEKNHGS
jgi:hypothetical protein